MQNNEKEKCAADLIVANNALRSQIEEKEKLIANLILANRDLVLHNEKKEKHAAELLSERENLYDELLKKESRFRALVEHSVDAVIILDKSGKPTYISPSVKRILGYSDEELMQNDLLAIAHPSDIPELLKTLEKVLANPGVAIKGHTGQLLHKDGRWRWLEATVTNLLHDPAINGIVDNFHDITDRKLAEEEIINLNRLYAFTSQINHTLVHSSDKKNVFKEACRIAVEIGKFKAAWIGIINAEELKIDLVEEYGMLPEDLSLLTNVSFRVNDPQHQVLVSGAYYVCNHIQNDLESTSWKPFAASRGFESCMVLPIKKSGTVIGTFNLYGAETDFFNAAEIALLEEAAGDISFALDIFEKDRLRTLAEQKLKHNEFRLKQAQSIAHLGSWEVDFSTGVSTWSDELLRIYGLPPEEHQQSRESWATFIHPDDLDHVMKITGEAIAAKSNVSFFHRIIRRDGTIRHLYSEAHTEFDKNGIAIGLMGIGHDITEMKKAEEALRESESNLQAFFQNTSEGFILTDLNGTITSFNQKSKEIISLNTGQEINIGDSIYDFVHPSRKDNYKDAISRVLAGEILRYDYPYERKNGEIKWFDFTVNPVYNAEIITGLSITSADITDRKQAEQLLQTSESNLNAIIENSDAFIYSLDTDLKYITFNSALKTTLKEVYGINITPGYHVFDFINEFDRAGAQQWNEAYNKALNGEIVKFEKEFSINGLYSCTTFSIHPIWKDQQVIGLSCFVNDITQQRQEINTRKRAEIEVLKVYEEKNIILESIGDAFFAVNNNWIVTYWNSQAEKLLGKSKDEMLNSGLWEIFSDSIGSVSFENYHHAINTNQPVHFEDYYGPLDKWYEISAYPSDNGLSIYFKDITARKLSEMLLIESEKKYSELFQLSPLPNWVFDINSLQFLDVNQAAINHYGYSREEFLAMTIKDIRPPEDFELMEDILTQYEQQDNFMLHRAVNHQKKNGERIQVDIQSNNILYKGKNARIIIASDITERLNYIKAIEEQNEKLKEISWMQSHVIRAPLASILGLIPLISNTSETSADREKMLEYLSLSAMELDKVIRSITDKTETVNLKK